MADFLSVNRMVYETSLSLATSATQAGLPWVGNFFNAPGSYSYPPGYVTNGKFTLSDPGLHILTAVYTCSGNPAFADCAYFMCWDQAWNSDYAKVRDLMSGFSWLLCYGGLDNAFTDAQLKTAAHGRRLTLTCQPITTFVMNRLAEIGITARPVALATAQAPNGFDDTHSIFEVRIGSKWCLFDIATGNAFEDASGNPLSLADVFSAGLSNVSMIDLGGTETNPSDGWKPNGGFPYDAHFLSEYRFGTPGWMARIYQIPGIKWSDGNFYFYLPAGTEGAQAQLLAMSPNWRVTTQADFMTKFYS